MDDEWILINFLQMQVWQSGPGSGSRPISLFPEDVSSLNFKQKDNTDNECTVLPDTATAISDSQVL